MQINISTRHGHLAPETQEKITQKLQKLSRFNVRISAVNVTVDLAHTSNPDVEIVVSVAGASNFVSRTTASGGKLIGAVDSALQKLEEQLKRHKQKKIDQHRVAAARHETTTPEEEDVDDDDLDAELD